MAELSTLSPLSALSPLYTLSHLYTCMLSAAEGRKSTPYQHICNSTNPTINNRYPHTALFLPLHILKCR